jgi:hypothetical protein
MAARLYRVASIETRRFLRQHFKAIVDINRRYSHPKVQMTPMVRASLLGLQFYLFFLVAILIYKFVTVVTVK